MIASRRVWVFDLDGTLTVAVHDFAAIKRLLGLPAERPLLESVLASPESERAALLAAIGRWEDEHAERATAQPGAEALLGALIGSGRRVGVLTRNSRDAALRTLDAAGLGGYFDAGAVVGRDEAPPKPAPDGLHLVARRLGASATEAVMVGDFRFDLEAARAAGALAVWLDADPGSGRAPLDALADLVVHGLDELRARLAP